MGIPAAVSLLLRGTKLTLAFKEKLESDIQQN
jgi:hypothetical protein